MVSLFLGGICFSFSFLFEDCRFLYWGVDGMSFIKIEFTEDLVDVQKLRKLDLLIYLIAFYFQA